MIDFRIEKISISFLKVRIFIRTIKEISSSEPNKKLQFYLLVGQNIELLDSTYFYTHSLPTVPRYTDKLLVNDEIIAFDYDAPALAQGVSCYIVTLNSYASIFSWKSELLFLKAKTIPTPIVSVANLYDEGLISTVQIPLLLDEEDKILNKFTIRQFISSEGAGRSSIAVSDLRYIDDSTITFTYPLLHKYGSYIVKTRIYNHNQNMVYEQLSRYIKIPELLPLAYREEWDPTPENNDETFTPKNFRVKKILNVFYKKDGVVYRVVDYQVKL